MTIDTAQLRAQNTLLHDQYTFYPAHVTVKHWQLRDLIHATDMGGGMSHDSVIYPVHNTIRQLSFDGSDQPLFEFQFEPRCVRVQNGIVAAGGVYDQSCGPRRPSLGSGLSRLTRPPASSPGLFCVGNIATKETYSGEIFTGEAINNAVTLYDNATKALVCNNDHLLYFLSIGSASFAVEDQFRFTSALNHASISPDNSTVVACGDSNQVYVCNRGAYGWVKTHTIEIGSESGFSTAFHPNGVLFGVASQDGVARLYDVRKHSKPLVEVPSSRREENHGAFRCLKFSEGPEDIMFISEHSGRVHMVDLRDFSNHQVLHLPYYSRPPKSMHHYYPEEWSQRSIRSARSGRSDISNSSSEYMAGSDISLDSEPQITPITDHAANYAPPVYSAFSAAPPSSSSSSRVSLPALNSGESRRLTYREHDISGMCWSPYDGGSLLVGTEKGITSWRVNVKSRRVFPSYDVC